MRLFIAVQIAPTPPMLDLLTELSRLGSLLKVVAPEQLHVTLRFIGEVSDSQLDALSAQLDAAVAGVRWFNLRLHGIATFPPGRHDGKRVPRVVYVDAPNAEPLHTIANRLALPGDKPFTAHVTVARHRPNRRPSRSQRDRLAALFERFADADLGTVPVREVSLVRSDLSAAGPRYFLLRRAALAL